MKKDAKVFLGHIFECIELIKIYLAEQTFDSFKSSVQLQDSLIRRLEIIGEAIKNLPEDLKKKFPDVAWRILLACEIFLFMNISVLILT